jgi:hypothetical protein
VFSEVGYAALALIALSLVIGLPLLVLAWRQRRRGANWGGAFLIGLPLTLLDS